MMMKNSERILLLTNYFAYGYTVQGKQVAMDLRVDLAENWIERFRDYIMIDAGKPTKIIANVLEEEIYFDNVPHLSGKDRKALLERKLDQHFRDSELRRYIVIGRDAEGRRDDKVMFASLGGCDEIHTLIDLLYSTETPIAGIYSAPHLCGNYLGPMVKRPAVLVMSEIDNGKPEQVAVRQSFFKDGKLRLTRVGQINVDNDETVIHDVEQELESSRHYLLREREINPDDQLEVIFVTSTEYLMNLAGDDNSMAEHFEFNHVSTGQLAALLGIATDNERPLFEDLIASHGNKPMPAGHYRSDRSSYFHKHDLLNRGIFHGGIAASVLLCAMSIYLFAERYAVQQDNAQTMRQIAMMDGSRGEPPLIDGMGKTEDIFQVKDAMDLIDSVESAQVLPQHIYTLISDALASYPAMEISSVSWSFQEREVAANNSAIDEDLDPMFYEEDQVSEVLVAKIKGRQVAYQDNVRQMVDDLNSFRAQLASQRQVMEVNVLAMPINVKPDAHLSGQVNRTSGSADTGEEKFELELVIDYANS